MSARFIDSATVQENHDRFIRRAIEHESVWTVRGDSGPLLVESEPDEIESGGEEADPRDVYLFFSDEAYAKRALAQSWPEHPESSARLIPLFEFLYRWLPGLQRDGHLVGTNWTGDLIGREVEPAELQAQLHAQLPDHIATRYRQAMDAAKQR